MRINFISGLSGFLSLCDGTMQIASLHSAARYAFWIGPRSMSSALRPPIVVLQSGHCIPPGILTGTKDTAWIQQKKRGGKNMKNKGFARSRSFSRTIGMQNASQEPLNPWAHYSHYNAIPICM